MNTDHLMDRRTVQGAPPKVAVGTQPLELTRSELVAGAQAGIGASIAMGLMAIVVSLSHGYGLWTPFHDVAGVLVPALAATGTGFSLLAVIIGTTVHIGLAMLLGVIFAALYAGALKLTFNVGMPIMIGVVFGLLTWLVARYAVLPLSGTEIYGAPAFLTVHAVFGAALGLLYPIMSARR